LDLSYFHCKFIYFISLTNWSLKIVNKEFSLFLKFERVYYF
jgi:hypothetical protein